MQQPKNNALPRLLMIVLVLITWLGIVLQQYILIDNTPENGMTPWQAVGRFLLFFTVLTNLLVAICYTSILVAPASALGRFFSKASSLAAVTLYIFIVGLVYNIVLRGIVKLEGWAIVANEIQHVVVPLLVIIYWIFFAKKAGLHRKLTIYWLIYPAAYLVYALLRGAMGNIYPYPFIDLNKLSYSQVGLNVILMLAAFLGFGMLIIAISPRLSRKDG